MDLEATIILGERVFKIVGPLVSDLISLIQSKGDAEDDAKLDFIISDAERRRKLAEEESK